ncbi:response regulator, partial [Streptomyces olivaceus]|uniref:response regulator n=1 Tax=Streptomyces olivaceus TaxID=47716 RepID=UPI004056A752
MPIRLLLADDHPVVRAGLRAVLETEEGITVAAEAATAEEAVERAGLGDIDVVLMDLRFGKGMNGARATAAITARPGAPRVLIVTTYDTDADTLPAIEAGATGYLLKDAPPEELAAGGGGGGGGGGARAPPAPPPPPTRRRAPPTPPTPPPTHEL